MLISITICDNLPIKPIFLFQVTFMIAQKRHNTRLFTVDPRDALGRAGNVPPGTVLDTDITHPTETDFFLASHEGLQVR